MSEALPGRRVPDATARIRAILDLAIRTAMMQLGSGAGAQDAVLTMNGITHAYGLGGADADVTHTELTLTWTNPSTDESVSRRHILPGRGLDYTRLTASALLYEDVARRHLTLGDARSRLVRMRRARPLVPVLVQRTGWALVGAGSAVLLGGGVLVTAVAFVAAFVMITTTGALASRRVPLLFQTFLGGVIGPVAALLVHVVQPEASATLVVVATIIVLLAGVTVFGAVQDILTAFYVSGVARLTEAVVATTGLAAGVLAASMLLNRFGAQLSIRAGGTSDTVPPAVAVAGSVVMVIGFALATQLPWRALWCTCLLGVIAEVLWLVCTSAGIATVWAAALAAVGVGIVASSLTRVVRTPVLPLIVSAVIPLLPGLSLFNGLMQIADSEVAGLFTSFQAAAIAAALASGAIFGHYVARAVTGRGRTVRLGKL